MNWPLDIFEDAARRAEALEAKMFNISLDKTHQSVHARGAKRKMELALARKGIPPLFLD